MPAVRHCGDEAVGRGPRAGSLRPDQGREENVVPTHALSLTVAATEGAQPEPLPATGHDAPR